MRDKAEKWMHVSTTGFSPTPQGAGDYNRESFLKSTFPYHMDGMEAQA